MAVAAASGTLMRFKCACLCVQKSRGICMQSFGKNRAFVSLSSRLAAQSFDVLGLKPLRTVSRSIGSSRQTRASVQTDRESQFPRPSSVAYDKGLANSVNLIGSVGVNPNIQYQDSGEIVATSSLSVKKTPQGDPTWFFLEFQSDLAESAAQHVRKGDRIHVAGRLVVENVTVPDDEQKQTLVKVAVTELHFVDDVYGAQAQAVPRRTTTTGAGGSPEKRQAAEKAWKGFFDNPNDWYDNRDSKRNPKAPDFKHKSTGDALWIDGFYVPSYVAEKIAELESDGVLKKIEKSAESAKPAQSSEPTGAYNMF